MTWIGANAKVGRVLDPLSPQVVYEDEDLLAVNKPPGVLVEGASSESETLESWVEAFSSRPARPLHRLDRDTSGLVLFARNARWNREWNRLFEEKRIRKEYWAIVSGLWDRGVNRIEAAIERIGEGRYACGPGGKAAKTTFRVLGRDASHSWIQALPKTGRTHQIRLHCLEAGHPIVGDRFYAPGSGDQLALHGRRLQFAHPNGSNGMDIVAEPPAFWDEWLSRFERRVDE